MLQTMGCRTDSHVSPFSWKNLGKQVTGSRRSLVLPRQAWNVHADALKTLGPVMVGVASATRSNKERTYPELLRAPQCRLVVLAIEVAGRWSAEAVQFVRLLARCRARSAPPHLRASSTAAWVQRWSGFLAFAAARSFAAPLLSLPLHGAANVDGSPPDLSDVLAEHRLDSPPHPSRLPARECASQVRCTPILVACSVHRPDRRFRALKVC